MPLPHDQDVAPLTLGYGETEFEVWLEPTCPYSKRAFAKLPPLLDAVGADRLTVHIRFVSQPWHLFSGIVTRAILAASATDGGRDTALRAMAGVYDNREAFEFDEHHTAGPNMDRTPNDILKAISDLAGVDLAEAWKLDSVGAALRWHTRYARQNGIHVSPTFAVNRMVDLSMGSGQSIDEWRSKLGV